MSESLESRYRGLRVMTTSDEALVQDQEASVLSKQLQAARVEQTTKLDLSGSCLAELPEAVFGLSSLRDLNLANNHLTELPKCAPTRARFDCGGQVPTMHDARFKLCLAPLQRCTCVATLV